MKITTKFLLKSPPSTDAGTYCGLDKSSFQWDTPVEGVWQDSKRKGVLVLGKEFIRLGGCPTTFKEDIPYIWGCFEEVL